MGERTDSSGTDHWPFQGLFGRLAVEVFVVCLGGVASAMDNTVPMIRRCVERVEFQGNAAGVDDVVIRTGRDDNRKTSLDRRPNAIENRLTGAFFHSKELVEFVDFRTDLFLGLQRHEDELAVFRGVEYPAKIVILDSESLDVLHKTFHDNSSFVMLPDWGV